MARQLTKQKHGRPTPRQQQTPILIGLLLLLFSTLGLAQVETIEFTELPEQPIDDLSIAGISFDFKVNGVDSTDATFGTATGPGSTSYIDSPNLEGDATGVLTLIFDKPVRHYGFGIALNTIPPVNTGCHRRYSTLKVTPSEPDLR